MSKKGRKKDKKGKIREVEKDLKKRFPSLTDPKLTTVTYIDEEGKKVTKTGFKTYPQRIRQQVKGVDRTETFLSTNQLKERGFKPGKGGEGEESAYEIADYENIFSKAARRKALEEEELERLALQEQLLSLNLKDRQIARLISEGKSPKRIGQIIGRHERTARRRSFRVGKDLRERIEKAVGEDYRITKFLLVLRIKGDYKQDYRVKRVVRKKYPGWLECQDEKKWRNFVKEYNQCVPAWGRMSEKKCQ